jgi:hypothetical protein
MRNNRKNKIGGAAPLSTPAGAHSYSPYAVNSDYVAMLSDPEGVQANSTRDGETTYLSGTTTTGDEIDLAKTLWDQLPAGQRAPSRPSGDFSHPPMPGPCTVNIDADGNPIRTHAANGTPKACPTAFVPSNPGNPAARGYKFYTSSNPSSPSIANPPPAVVGGSRKNKSRQLSRNMARKHSRRSTRRSSTRKAVRKGSRKTRRSSRK